MRVLLIDDELFSLMYMANLCMQMPGIDIAGQFQDAGEALVFLNNNPVDLIFTDIEMPGLSGIEAVHAIRRICQEVGIVFITGYEEYAMEAFRLDAISYLMKPCTLEQLTGAVEKARKLLPKPRCRVEIKTFGNFRLLVEGKPVRFSNSKAQELLAFLVDRNGSIMTMEQIIDCLWEERPYDEMVKRLYRKAVSYLHQLCRDYELDFFISNRGSCYVIPAGVECDYFRLLKGDRQAVLDYHGEYMTEYSWAESTNGKLYSIAEVHGR